MKVVLLESAEKLIAEGYYFYEKQEEGLGQYFRKSILKDLRSLEIFDGIHTRFFDGYYRVISKRFPFAITIRSKAIPRWCMP